MEKLGELSDDELSSLSALVHHEQYERSMEKFKEKAKKVGYYGITTKDIVAHIYHDDYADDDEKDYGWQFFTKDGKCLYYDIKKSKFYKPDPEDPEGDEVYSVFELIPEGFREMGENWYEFDGEMDEAKAKLAEWGIEIVDKR